MPILGDSPELGALADYLDFLDVHDRNALGITSLVRPPAPATSYAPPPVRYAAAPALTRAPLQPAQRLVSAMIPAGRAVTIPFGASRPSLLNPGVPVQDSTGLTPSMVAAPPMTSPTQAPVQTYSAAPNLGPTSYVPQGQGQDPGPPPGDPNSGYSASGSSGLFSSEVGWLLLLAGGYLMYRSL